MYREVKIIKRGVENFNVTDVVTLIEQHAKRLVDAGLAAYTDQPQPKVKADHWIGLIYAITNCILEIQNLKKQLKKIIGEEVPLKDVNRVQLRLDDWVAAAVDLYERDKTLFNAILDEINKDHAPQNNIAEIMRLYEIENTEIKKLVRRVVEICLRGYKETYSRSGIHWDSWDWESNLVWNGSVSEIIDKLKTAGLRESVKIMIGGGTVDERIVGYIGADAYGESAVDAVNLAKEWMGV